MDTQLLKAHCVPCEGGTAPMTAPEIKENLAKLTTKWEVEDNGKKIEKEFEFDGFVEAIAFVNKVADLAESEGHHPDIEIKYNKVEIELWTHAIGGLSTNDFILARKIEELV